MMFRKILLGLSAGALAGLAHAEIKLVDGGFETTKPGAAWRLPKGWSFVPGAGRKGSTALVWDNADPGHYAFPHQQLVAEPGARFRFGGWVKAERGDLAQLTPHVEVDWCDAKGTWMSAAGSRRVVDNDPNTAGWSRFEGAFTFPKGAATAKFLCYLPRGKTGRVLFDDLTLEQVPDEPLVYLQCAAYRNAFTAADGDIRFAAMLRLNTIRNSLGDYACAVAYRGVDGAEVVRPVAGFDEEKALFSIPAAEMALGRQEVALRLSLKGKVVAEAKRAVTRTAEPVRRRITVDRDHRVRIDGRRFFPLGMYTNRGMTPEDFELWAQAPLNFTTMYGGVDRATLDRFAKTGTYVCPDVRGLIYGYNYSAVNRFKGFDETRAAFAKRVAELAGHPNFFGWYLVDEVPLDQAPFVTAANELLQELDPDHPTYAVTDKPHHIRELLPTFDAVGMDPYPVGGWKRDMTIASVWAEQCREGMFGFRPMWHVPQLFNWAWYAKPGIQDYKSTARRPTRAEMANMVWQGIAAGANGICGYSFGSMRKNSPKAEQEKFWPDVCHVLREVKSMEDVLLAEDIALPFQDLPKTLVARAYRHGGADYVLVVNRTAEKASAALKLEGEPYRGLSTCCGAGVRLEDGGLKVDFDGLGYAFLKLEGNHGN